MIRLLGWLGMLLIVIGSSIVSNIFSAMFGLAVLLIIIGVIFCIDSTIMNTAIAITKVLEEKTNKLSGHISN